MPWLERPRGSRGQRRPIASTISAALSTASGRQPLRLPTSMNSIRRSSTPRSRASAARGSSWSSLRPRWITALSLRAPSAGSKPAAWACSIAASTFASSTSPAGAPPASPAIAATAAPSAPSRLRVRRSRPARRRARARSALSRAPLLVRAISARHPPGARRQRAAAAIRVSSWGFSSGSPPVRRRLRAPSDTAAPITASRCSRVSSPGGSWPSGRQ